MSNIVVHSAQQSRKAAHDKGEPGKTRKEGQCIRESLNKNLMHLCITELTWIRWSLCILHEACRHRQRAVPTVSKANKIPSFLKRRHYVDTLDVLILITDR